MKLTDSQREKLNDFRNAYMQIFNPNNEEYTTLVINTIFANVEKNYEEFSDEIDRIFVSQENDELNIIKPTNGYYPLLDFLLNRIFKNIQSIVYDDGNAISYRDKKIIINRHRYDDYYDWRDNQNNRLFSDDFLLHQKIKSIMHESGHALQNKRESDFNIENLQRLAYRFKSILGSKYALNDTFTNISNHHQITPFNNESRLGEGIDEMYAALFSGVLSYKLNDSNLRNGLYYKNETTDADGKTKTSVRRNCFNGYGHSKYFYPIRALVSKQSIFNSMYFGKKDMLDEFYVNYKEIVDKYESRTDSSIINQISRFNGNFFERLLMEVSTRYFNQGEDSKDKHIQDAIKEIYKYEKILDDIFVEAFQKKINALSAKDEILEATLGNVCNDANIYIIDGKHVDSPERTKYYELYQKVKQKNGTLPDTKINSQNSINQNPNSNQVLAYGIFDVNVISNPDHNMKIIVYLKNNEFEVNQIELKENNDFTIIKEKNSICKLIEKYLNRHKQELIDSPRVIIEIFNNIGTYIPEITISRNNGEYESGSYGSK